MYSIKSGGTFSFVQLCVDEGVSLYRLFVDRAQRHTHTTPHVPVPITD